MDGKELLLLSLPRSQLSKSKNTGQRKTTKKLGANFAR